MTGMPVTAEYRPALDGIRAVAVLAVFGYHLQLAWLRGGFLGVDVFFVLSGYLITGLLLAEHAASGRISLAAFWTRRARRLFPALLALLVCVAFAVQKLRPVAEWSPRTFDLRWTLLYGANWHQVIESRDYFAQWSAASPLRHMWSIAIEEQFYLAWPLLMMLALTRRLRRWLLPGIIVSAIASAAAMFWLFDPSNPTRAYVGTDTRAQQLLVGAALAVMMQRRRGGAVAAAPGAAAWIGPLCAAAVLLALAVFPDSSRLYYRGGATLVALAVAAMLWCVDSVPRGALARALSVGPLTWIGRVSYGLYLWHWPAIIFTPTLLVRWFGGRGLKLIEQRLSLNLLCVAVALLCTVVSYYAIEWPIRHGRFARRLRPRAVAIAGIAAAGAALVIMRAALLVPDDLLTQVTRVEVACEGPACTMVQAGPGRPVMAVMGDSVALSLVPAFTQVAQDHGWTLVAAAHTGCTVIQHWVHIAKWDRCFNMVPVVQEKVLAYRPALIVITDNWLAMSSHDDHGKVLERETPEHVADIERRMGPLMEQLTASGTMVVLMHLINETPLLDCLDPARAAATKLCDPAPPNSPRFAPYNAMFDRLARRYPDRVRVLDLGDIVCPDNKCTYKVDGRILRSDALHFSVEGARWIAPHLERRLIAAGVALDL